MHFYEFFLFSILPKYKRSADSKNLCPVLNYCLSEMCRSEFCLIYFVHFYRSVLLLSLDGILLVLLLYMSMFLLNHKKAILCDFDSFIYLVIAIDNVSRTLQKFIRYCCAPTNADVAIS